MTNYVLYKRISGGHNQVKSGLGLEAQQNEIDMYLQSTGEYQIKGTFTEIASGKDHKNRPELHAAIETAIKTKSILLCSRLCRLSRDLEFVAALMKNTKVTVKIATQPNADNFTLAIYAAMVTREREMISIRTKAALRVARRNGTQLGKMGSQNIKKANQIRVESADRFAAQVNKIITPLRQQQKTYWQIANVLNDINFTTPRGGSFSASQVRRYAMR